MCVVNSDNIGKYLLTDIPGIYICMMRTCNNKLITAVCNRAIVYIFHYCESFCVAIKMCCFNTAAMCCCRFLPALTTPHESYEQYTKWRLL